MRRATLTNSLTKGVLDETISDRIDLVHYYQGVRVGRNSMIRPQGGLRRRAGTMLASGMDLFSSGLKRRLRRRLEPVHVPAGMVTVANGGVGESLVSQSVAAADTFVSDPVSGPVFVLAEIDLGSAREIAAVDVARFACAEGGADDALAVEYWTGSAWVQLDTRRNIRAMGGAKKDPVRVATTKEIDLSGEQEINGVAVVTNDRVLVKHQSDATKNGIYFCTPSGWGRTADANTGDKLEQFIVYVEEGERDGGTWWEQPEDRITINKSPILFYRLAGPERSRRFATPPGGLDGVPLQARHLRLVAYDAEGCGAISIGRVRVWVEQAAASPVAFVPFAVSIDTRYEIVLLDRTVDVYRDHRWISSAALPADAAQVTEVKRSASGDGFAVYHGDVVTTVVMRQGGDDEWDASPAPFANMPSLSASTAISGSADEMQRLSLAEIAAGQSFVLWVDDEVTAPVPFVDAAGLPAAIAAALAALPALGGESPAVTLTDAATRTVDIVFSGPLGGRRWAPVLARVLVSTLTPATSIVRRGVDASGLIASARTGWPRCGVFHQNRHFLAGFRASPQTIFPSRAETAWDFETQATPLTPDLAYIDPIASDQAETILELTVGRHLMALTESGVWFQEARTYDATQSRNWRLAARPGVEAGVPVVHLDDAPLYMQAGELQPGGGRAASRVMRELNMVTAVDATYVANVKNVLAPRLVSGAVAFFGAETRSGDEAARGWVVNADGTLAHMATLRDQEVVAFLPWDTDGRFVDGGVDIAGNIWLIVARDGDHYLERLDERTPLDATLVYDFAEPTAVLTGLEVHEGHDLVVYADRDLIGTCRVTGGKLTLPAPAREVMVGRSVAWEAESMPFREKLTEAQPFRVPARIYEMEFTVRATGPFEVSVNGGPYRPAPVTFFGERLRDPSPFQAGGEMDLPLLDRLYTGVVRLEGLLGVSHHPRWSVRQALPAPIEITAVRLGISYRG